MLSMKLLVRCLVIGLMFCGRQGNGTPTVAVIDSSVIVLATNAVNDTGGLCCKLAHTGHAAIAIASNTPGMAFRRNGKLQTYHTLALLKLALDGDPRIEATEARVIKAMEHAMEFYVNQDRSVLREREIEEFNTRLLLVTVYDGHPKAVGLLVSFSPELTAQVKRFPLDPKNGTIGIQWQLHSAPLIMPIRGWTESGFPTLADKVLHEIASRHKPELDKDWQSYQPPTNMVEADKDGVRWIRGDESKCREYDDPAVVPQ